MTTTRPGPSLRSRAVRRLFVVALHAMRRFGAGGTPPPDAPRPELEAYALQLRDATERTLSRAPVGSDVEVVALAGAPVPGLVVAPRRLGAIPTGSTAQAEWLAAAPRVVLHLHGGAYILLSPNTHRGLGAAIARRADAVVVLPDYRLAPEHPFPAALDDAAASYRWLVGGAGVRPERMAVSGDSAGGGLGAALLVRLRDAGEVLPACYVGMSPWLDLAGTGASMTELDGADPWISAAMTAPAALAYAGDTPLDHPEVSPLYADPAGLPPMLLHVGGDEVLRDDAVRFTARARAAGVEASHGIYPGLWHVFQAFPGLPESRDAVAEIGGFLRRHIPDDGVAAGPGQRGAAGHRGVSDPRTRAVRP